MGLLWPYKLLRNILHGVVNRVLDWNFSGVLDTDTTLYYVETAFLIGTIRQGDACCTSHMQPRNGAAIDCSGYILPTPPELLPS